MTTTTTHTPTPWKVKGVHVGPSRHFRAYTIEPNICEMNSSLSPEEVSANAAHIVQCVNEREELLGLLKRAAVSLQEYCDETDGERNDSLAMEIDALLTRAEQEGLPHA